MNFEIKKNILLACHITGIYDVNRNEILDDDNFSIVQKWAKSIEKLNLQGIIFHNNFSETTCAAHQNENIAFVKIQYDNRFNPNVFRYLIYENFLNQNFQRVDNVFVTDISDVVVLKNPFVQELYLNNPNSIFCGDEPKTLDNEWMKEHCQHLRSKISDFTFFEHNFKNEVLLNCGIIGGNSKIMKIFINQLSALHKKFNYDNSTAFTGDMGAFNYLVRTQFNDNIIHGNPVNTEFKKYHNDTVSWFMHK